ncbi:hypothetical protein GS924_25050 [Rhodococcus hoagii]|nr:hypothetical protein [Prescottella equi]
MFQSVLDLAKGAGGLTSLPLNWHYRSRHEDLITYSNYRFYDGKLFTFPSAVFDDAPNLGVELIPVNGTYRRGTSRDNRWRPPRSSSGCFTSPSTTPVNRSAW